MKITVLGSSHGNPTPGRFQTSVLLETGGGYYLVDAGEPANASLINRGLDASQLSAVFISHMHLDHTGGLPVLCQQAAKHRHLFPDRRTEIWLPDPAAGRALAGWCEANDGWAEDACPVRFISADAVYRDGRVTVRFIPTGHIAPAADGSPRSYAMIFEAEGKKVLFSGDLRPDFGDFPTAAAAGCQLVFCELTHYDLKEALPELRKISPGKLVFYHLHTPHQSREGAEKVRHLCGGLSCPVTLSRDGDRFEV